MAKIDLCLLDSGTANLEKLQDQIEQHIHKKQTKQKAQNQAKKKFRKATK